MRATPRCRATSGCRGRARARHAPAEPRRSRWRPGGSCGWSRSAARAARPWPKGFGAPLVVARPRAGRHAGGRLDRQVVAGHHLDRFEPPFGGAAFSNASLARPWIASSVSSSVIRFFAAVSAASPYWSARAPGPWRPVLAAPGTDRLIADAQVPGDVSDLAAGLEQGPAPCDGTRADTHVVPRGPPWKVRCNKNPVSRLRETRDTPQSPNTPGRLKPQLRPGVRAFLADDNAHAGGQPVRVWAGNVNPTE